MASSATRSANPGKHLLLVIAMWCYAAVLIGIAVIAEVVGLGGTPAQAVGLENILFIGLLLTLIATVFRGFARR